MGLINYAAFFALMVVLLKPFFVISTDSAEVVKMGVEYGKIVFYFSFGIFIESNCTKIMQAKGRMVIPMTAQVLGAVVNIILDPILIFGNGFVPELGIRGAAIATVIGQASAMCIVLLAVLLKDVRGGRIKKRLISAIYKEGFPSIVMQSLYTLYIIGLNLILKSFTEDAVTVLGIYYKLQTFFFIPLFGLEYIVLPIVSYNYGARQFDRISQAVKYSVIFGSVLLGVGTFVFVAFPEKLLMIFSASENVMEIGVPALRIIGCSFVPGAYSSIYSASFQGVRRGKESLILTLLRQVVLLVPLAWIFHYFGLTAVWFTFPVTELLTALCAFKLKKHMPKKQDLML